jgi:hypothetical protein
MNVLPDELVVGVCAFLTTREGASLATTCRSYCALTRRCSWLWRTLRLPGKECTSWRHKRPREEGPLPPALVPRLLRLYGTHLHTLILGSHCLIPGFVLTNDHLFLIGKFAPQLQFLRLAFARSFVTPNGLHALADACPRLTGLDIATTLCVDTTLTREPADWSELKELQLHGEGLNLLRMLNSALPYQSLTVLRLVNITMINSLVLLTQCTSLVSLWIHNCVAFTTHPEHLHETLTYTPVLAQLHTLHVIDSPTVVCISTMLGDIEWGVSPRWSCLEQLGITLADAEHAAETNDIRLSCITGCTRIYAPLGIAIARCAACREHARPKLGKLWYWTGINF